MSLTTFYVTGTVIDFFNNSAISWLDPCPYLNITADRDVVLAKNLTYPSCVSN